MDTIANIKVEPGQVVDLYATTGIAVGIQISTQLIGNGAARLYSFASAPSGAELEVGYRPIYGDQEKFNKETDAGAFIYSIHGCTVNVQEA